MKKSERLAQLINLPIEIVENDIDKGMWDILIELNSKNYFTDNCCEGHLNNGSWNGYISFKKAYKFSEYPIRYDNAKQKRAFYWSGKDEESRQEYLHNLYEWASNLPKREIKEVIVYTLWGKNKRRPNGVYKVLKRSTNYDDIRIELNKKNTEKYEIKIEKFVLERY